MPIQRSPAERARGDMHGITEGLLLGLTSVEDFSPAFLSAFGALDPSDDPDGDWAAVAACVTKWEERRSMHIVDELRALCYQARRELD